MSHRIELAGQVFGRLTVTKHVVASYWETKCECGNVQIVKSQALRNGNTRSCGCIRNEKAKERMTQHGMYRTRTYNSWVQMRRRCSDPNHQNYKWYGARGIMYDPRWDDFREFLKDMGECPSPEHRIDRKDPEGHYTKDNCQWSVLEGTKRRNTPITKNGMPLKEYAASIGLKYHTAYARWRAGTLD